MKVITSSRFDKEKSYAIHVICSELLNIPYEIEWRSDEPNYRLVLPSGVALVIEDHFFGQIEDSDYCARQYVPEQAAECLNPFNQLPLTVIFGSGRFDLQPSNACCGIDLFASAFFMLTRWEERALPVRDKHGRFPAAESLAFRCGFLHRPVVHEWAELLGQLLIHLGFTLPPMKRQYQLHVSCDVDHPRLWWSAKDRIKTLTGALLKRKSVSEFIYLLRNQFFTKKDPYDIFDEWFGLFHQNHLTVQFNLMGKRAPQSDCWYPLDHPFVQHLIKRIQTEGHHIGLHPSYESLNNPEVIIQEKTSLEIPVSKGRQHYLRCTIPETWRTWAEAGMMEDSTMGYPESEGFRCGICIAYPVFDITQRTVLQLKELPLIAMDVTLAQYQHYSPQEALHRLETLSAQVRRHQGVFTLLWHNSSWNTYFWAPWKRVFHHALTHFR
ncbi:MAG: polysaccharide deacetylase family protein [Saprospiraceae bacterium]|nr:polysaccharide deacetylase family protein [Saprospiraceae bacterium]